GEIEYPSSLIYLAEELCRGSKSFRRNLAVDNNCQILTNVIGATESRLSASFSNILLIESESDANLLGGDN
ncbi:hypothetical protein GW17_00042487, partial [Ensete ventricosum]